VPLPISCVVLLFLLCTRTCASSEALPNGAIPSAVQCCDLLTFTIFVPQPSTVSDDQLSQSWYKPLCDPRTQVQSVGLYTGNGSRVEVEVLGWRRTSFTRNTNLTRGHEITTFNLHWISELVETKATIVPTEARRQSQNTSITHWQAYLLPSPNLHQAQTHAYSTLSPLPLQRSNTIVLPCLLTPALV
jgi:hypothetical protein